MLRNMLRALPVILLSAMSAMAQGNFAHFTYGGGYTSTFTFVNQDPIATAQATLYFYGDDGTAMTVPVQANGATSPTTVNGHYDFSIPGGGSITIAVPDPGTANAPWGSAQLVVTNYVNVNGQLAFRRAGSGTTPATEAVVPLSGTQGPCIYPLPVVTPTTIIPFDNTGVHGTAIALSNTTTGSLTLTYEFFDQSGTSLKKVTGVSIKALNHTAWDVPSSYAETKGKVGTLKITGMTYSADLAIVALLYTQANTLTTVLPITQ